jgi:hypothetical protein
LDRILPVGRTEFLVPVNQEITTRVAMNTAIKVGPNTQTDRGTFPGVGA